MSLAVGAVSSSKSMVLDERKEASAVAENENAGSVAADGAHKRHMSEASCYYESEEDDDDEEGKGNRTFELGPQFTIKEQFEKDKDDESLRRWKEQLLRNVDLNSVGGNLDPDVKIVSISILSPGRPEVALPLPLPVSNPKGLWFTLKEGSCYTLKFSFLVSYNIVSGFTYTNTVWKTGVKVDSTKQMLGTFSPQPEPYIFEITEETTPSGMFARGSYSAKTKMMTKSATWRSITPLTSAKNGLRLAENSHITFRCSPHRILFSDLSEENYLCADTSSNTPFTELDLHFEFHVP